MTRTVEDKMRKRPCESQHILIVMRAEGVLLHDVLVIL